MSRFQQAEKDIFGVFADPSWTLENIKTIPNNFPTDGLLEFVRVSVIPSGMPLNENSASGLIIAEIFSQAGVGPKRASELADKLDKYLSKRTINSVAGKVTQTHLGVRSSLVADKDNPNLVKSTFSVSFNHFGVQQ